MHTGSRNFQNASNVMPAGRLALCVIAHDVRWRLISHNGYLFRQIPMASMEWHILRAMHLAGRCISCGECGRACPVGIPCHLLTMQLTDQVYNYFKVYAGTSDKMNSVLSTFEPNDKESFII